MNMMPFMSNIRTTEERDAWLSGYSDGSAWMRGLHNYSKAKRQMPLEVRAALESNDMINRSWGGGFICAVEELLSTKEAYQRQGLILWFAASAICLGIAALVFFYQ